MADKLVVLKQQDTISAETSLVGGENFRIVTSMVGFAPNSQNFSKVKFVGAENALVYEVRMVFNYKEKIHNGPMTDKQVSWSLGTVNVNDLDIENGSYSMNYSQTALFTKSTLPMAALTKPFQNTPTCMEALVCSRRVSIL